MMLMEEAERIARDEHGSGKLAVISGKKKKKRKKEQATFIPNNRVLYIFAYRCQIITIVVQMQLITIN